MIFHIDVNCTFLSWEVVYRLRNLREREDLREQVVAAGGDMVMRHEIFLEKYIPAKKYHIKAGETILEVKRKCPGVILVLSHCGLYEKCSKVFLNLLR